MSDVIILGAGPAGMTAALYCLRNGKSVTIFEKNAVGGQIAIAPRVENYPAIDSITGEELSDKMFQQILDKGVDFQFGEVDEIKKEGDHFVVATQEERFTARSVIIAVGVKRRTLNIEGEEELVGHGISYCAICDGPFYKDEEVVLVGDANSALQYALLLASYCKKVKMVTMFDHFFFFFFLIKQVKANPKIEVIHDYKTVGFEGEKELEAVNFVNAAGDKLRIATRALFVAIGQVSSNTAFADMVDLDKGGFIIADDDMKTKTEGLFVCGDCRAKTVRQVTTACGDGAIAATSACKYLDK